MQFKYPEILFALFLLLIPIIVHLFQLRRFQKVPFTNVAFLKKVEIQTRKSSKLKKLLILASRLLLFATLILGFAQPYFSENKTGLKPQTVIYLDNSLSMQAKNGSHELFKKAVQDVISNSPSGENITVLTNNEVHKDLTDKDLKNQLLSLDYSPATTDLHTTLLKINDAAPQKEDTKNHIVLISDFQKKTKDLSDIPLDSLNQYAFVQITPQKKANISIDSLYIANKNAQEVTLHVRLKNYNVSDGNLAVSLFKENALIAKTTATVDKDQSTLITFTFPFNEDFNGIVRIEDNLFSFDNTAYFSLNKLERIHVLGIGDDTTFLSKIYTDEFTFTSKKVNQLDYNQIKDQHLIVLNELEQIPLSLQQVLKDYITSGGSLVVIPSTKTLVSNYNEFFSNLHIGKIDQKKTAENKITKINFSHPLLDKVFEKQVSNFQYPNVLSGYPTQLNNGSSILQFENQEPFLSQVNVSKGKVFWCSAALNTGNSNFTNSPLVVPVFYNFGKQSYNITSLYYTVGKQNTFEIQAQIGKDDVLQIKNESLSFIPLQQINQSSVKITTDENPLQAGHYGVFNKEEDIKNIAYNYHREESIPVYEPIKEQFKGYTNVSFSTSITEAFNALENTYKVKSLWKWFVLLAILFLLIELLLIKFWKK